MRYFLAGRYLDLLPACKHYPRRSGQQYLKPNNFSQLSISHKEKVKKFENFDYYSHTVQVVPSNINVASKKLGQISVLFKTVITLHFRNYMPVIPFHG